MSLITEPSICIPRTLNNVTWRDVKEVFEAILGRGTVERVDIVQNRHETTPFCRIFVHFRYWPVDKPEHAAMRKRLLDGETVKVVYDNPWFWKCSASRLPKPENTREKAAPFVEFQAEPGTGWQCAGGETEEEYLKRKAKLDDAIKNEQPRAEPTLE